MFFFFLNVTTPTKIYTLSLHDALPISPFEFCGIRIGDEMKEAERKFLALKIPSLSSKPGLCGSDGINRIETCTDVLDTGDRKSTRLNSSHANISYAVFCLKKKKTK